MYSQNYYQNKYLKYKIKYLELKNSHTFINMTGSGKPLIDPTKHKINFFDHTNNEMEEYLNPIYGLIMCESGYIQNNFHLIDK